MKNITIVTTQFHTAKREVILSDDFHCNKNAEFVHKIRHLANVLIRVRITANTTVQENHTYQICQVWLVSAHKFPALEEVNPGVSSLIQRLSHVPLQVVSVGQRSLVTTVY